MKNIVLLLLISLSVLGQKITYVDSVYFKYTKKNGDLYTIQKIEPYEELLMSEPYLRMATNENLNKFLSDSLKKLFKINGRKISKKKLGVELESVRDLIALDSNSNVLFVRVISEHCECSKNLIKLIVEDEELYGLLSDKKCKSVKVNYVQLTDYERHDIIIVTIGLKRRYKEVFYIHISDN
jgi:hypothetical protein